jgi:hypothetical protein
MKEIFTALISGGFFVFLEFLIKRWDNKHSDISSIKESISKNSESIEAIRKILLNISTDNKTQSDILDAQAEAIMGLGHDKIIYLGQQIARRGMITLKEKSNLQALYVPYSKLGGNGDGKTMYEHCMALPACSEERALELDRQLKRHLYGIDILEEKHDDEQSL